MSKELIPPDYQAFLQTITSHIQQAQLQAVLAVNRELILLNWQIGRSILERQQQQGWGAKVVNTLANDLHAAFPQMKGFSIRNLKYMRAFALAYSDESFVQQVAAQIPWGHHCLLLDRVKDAQERRWYLQQSIEHGWSRNILEIQIETGVFQRQGKALTNFHATRRRIKSSQNMLWLTSASQLGSLPTNSQPHFLKR